MSFIITGKGDFNLLKKYKQGDFSEYELYLKTSDDCNIQKYDQLPSHIKLISVHNPVYVKVGTELKHFNIADTKEIGNASKESLRKTIEFAISCSIRRVVVHGAFGDGKSYEILKERLEKYVDKIELSFETDALWFNRQDALLTGIEDFQKLLETFNYKVTITVDIEHLILTSIFKTINKNKDLDNISDTAIINSYKKFIESFFTRFNKSIRHIHLNGSDFRNFNQKQENGPLKGEHLPLGYDEIIKDRIDYEWLSTTLQSLSNKHINIVLELGLRPDYDFIEEMTKSKKHLERYLNIVNKQQYMQKCVIIGAGGHGKVIADILESNGDIECLGFLDDNAEKQGKEIIAGLKVIGTTSKAQNIDSNFIISIGTNHIREKIYNDLKSKGKTFINAIHPTAFISKNAELGEGNSICAKAFIGPGSKIGNNCIINTAATIDHDNIIHDNAQIAPGAHLGGTVTIGKNAFIGLGSSVIQEKKIGEYALVGAGAVVVKDVNKNTLVIGVPAKPMRELKNDEL